MASSIRPVLLVLSVFFISPMVSAGEPAVPLIVAHRGLLRHAPENTLANFRACLELRIGFEFDVRETKDGHLVCIHDDTVDRTTDESGRVSDMTLEELQKLDTGSWFNSRFADQTVPTVDQVLKLIADYRHHNVLIAADIKVDSAARGVVELARNHKVLDRLMFIGRTITRPDLRKRIRQASENAHTAAVANDAGEFADALNAPNADWVYVRFLPTREQIDAVHHAGKYAFIAGSTVSGHSPDNWQHAAQAGINAILTDYPLVLQTVTWEQPPGRP